MLINLLESSSIKSASDTELDRTLTTDIAAVSSKSLPSITFNKFVRDFLFSSILAALISFVKPHARPV